MRRNRGYEEEERETEPRHDQIPQDPYICKARRDQYPEVKKHGEGRRASLRVCLLGVLGSVMVWLKGTLTLCLGWMKPTFRGQVHSRTDGRKGGYYGGNIESSINPGVLEVVQQQELEFRRGHRRPRC
ncbi:hypothetical protein VNO77_22990 [Canavalia gladiata]|uniref:Uncharacterized protein n=1 Tax=Canavalia gladiata TaxID=3824 RepID=A0AAN9QEZ6_CANGL